MDFLHEFQFVSSSMFKSLFRKSEATNPKLNRTVSDATPSVDVQQVPSTPISKRRKSDIRDLLPEILTRDEPINFRLLAQGEEVTDFYALEKPFYEVGSKSVTRCTSVSTGSAYIMKRRAREPGSDSERIWRSIMNKILRMEYCPNIVQLHEILEDENSFYIVMEECTGGQLLDYLLNKPTMTQRECKRLIRDILTALSRLHEVGLIHRDIKPENIMFENKDYENEEKNCLKLIDFDTCEEIGSDRLSTTTPSRKRITRRVIGTLGYIAPESFSGEYSISSDLFSVGVIFFILITGDMPFDDSIYQLNMPPPTNTTALDGYNTPPLSSDSGMDIQIVGSPRNRQVVSKFKNSKIDWNMSPWSQLPLARDLCQKLLELDPDSRLSLAKDALNHPWLAGNTGRQSPTRKPSIVNQ
jgi:serine/threonine protein kinase